MSAIYITCPNCGHDIHIGYSPSDDDVQCPECYNSYLVRLSASGNWIIPGDVRIHGIAHELAETKKKLKEAEDCLLSIKNMLTTRN